MKKFVIKRVSENKDGTFGVLIKDSVQFAVTLEKRWVNNYPNESCIPAMTYRCERIISPRFGETFEVMYVAGRTHILFHKGNTNRDSRGCILIAESFDYLNGKAAILSSGKGFKEFMSMVKGDNTFELRIIDLTF